MASTDNPFMQVFDELWNLLEASIPFQTLVKDGNRIKFNHPRNRDPVKQEIAVADLPEVILTSEGTLDVNLHRTSCSSSILRQYSWILTTGDQRINYALHDVEWAIFCAMVNFQSVLMPLTWEGTKFVKDANLLSLTEGLSNPEFNRGIEGWSGQWRCAVRFELSTQQLIDFNT